MTIPFSPSNIAQGADTLQKVLMQLTMAFQSATRGKSTREEEGVLNPYCMYNIKLNDQGQEYFVARISIPMENVNAVNASFKPWLRADDVPGAESQFPQGFN